MCTTRQDLSKFLHSQTWTVLSKLSHLTTSLPQHDVLHILADQSQFFYYSFKITLRFWLARFPRLIFLNQRALTKFGWRLRYSVTWRLKYGLCQKRDGKREALGMRVRSLSRLVSWRKKREISHVFQRRSKRTSALRHALQKLNGWKLMCKEYLLELNISLYPEFAEKRAN